MRHSGATIESVNATCNRATSTSVVKFKKDSVTACEDVFVVRGEGMPRKGGGGFGNLFVDFKIVYPKHLSAKQKEFISQALH